MTIPTYVGCRHPALLRPTEREGLLRIAGAFAYFARRERIQQVRLDGMPRVPHLDTGEHEAVLALVGRHGAGRLFRIWWLRMGFRDGLLYAAAREAGMTGNRAKRVVKAVVEELVERLTRDAMAA